MQSLWQTLERGRDGVFAGGIAIVRRTRETGAEVLGRAEHRAITLQERVAARRSTLNGKPIERAERRLLTTFEMLLDRMGLGLREQIRRLAPDAGTSAMLEPASERFRESAAPAKRAKKRIRIEVRDVPAASERAPSAKSNGKRSPKESARPAARRATAKTARSSTRWVAPPAEVIDELTKLPVKTLVARIASLSDDERRALLALEKTTKQRKSVITALERSLAS